MLLGDLPHDREAEPRALGFRGEEGLEQPPAHLAGDARARVRHRDLDVLADEPAADVSAPRCDSASRPFFTRFVHA